DSHSHQPLDAVSQQSRYLDAACSARCTYHCDSPVARRRTSSPARLHWRQLWFRVCPGAFCWRLAEQRYSASHCLGSGSRVSAGAGYCGSWVASRHTQQKTATQPVSSKQQEQRSWHGCSSGAAARIQHHKLCSGSTVSWRILAAAGAGLQWPCAVCVSGHVQLDVQAAVWPQQQSKRHDAVLCGLLHCVCTSCRHQAGQQAHGRGSSSMWRVCLDGAVLPGPGSKSAALAAAGLPAASGGCWRHCRHTECGEADQGRPHQPGRHSDGTGHELGQRAAYSSAPARDMDDAALWVPLCGWQLCSAAGGGTDAAAGYWAAVGCQKDTSGRAGKEGAVAGMLNFQKSLANRSCGFRGIAVLAAASRGSTGRHASTARTTRISSSKGLPNVYEPGNSQASTLPPQGRTNRTVHNGASFATYSTSSSTNKPSGHSTSTPLVASPLPPAAAEMDDMPQHAGVPLGSQAAAETAVDPAAPAAAGQLQHVTAAATGDAAPLSAPEKAGTEADQPAAAAPTAAITAAHAAVPATSSSSSSSNGIHQASVLAIEAFASSYQVARQLRLVNVDAAHTGLHVSAYAAVELDSYSHQHSPNGFVVGVGRDRYANIHGSLKDAAVQGQLLRFVQRMLQQSADGSGQRIDSVVVFASPAAEAACDVYSTPSLSRTGLSVDAAGRLQQPQNEQQQEMVQQLQQQLYEADRHVSSVLEVYRMIQALCAAAVEAVQPAQGSTAGSAAHIQDAVQALQPTLTRLVMVGPWSDEQLLLPMTTKKHEASRQRAAAAAARQRQGLQQTSPGSSVINITSASETIDEGESEVRDFSVTASGAEPEAAAAALRDDAAAMEVVPFGLHRRPLLEPQLAGSLTGGNLQVSKQPWCMYGELKGAMPPLAVITDMPGLTDGGCICNACDRPAEEQEETEADTDELGTAAAAAAAAGDTGSGREVAVQEGPLQPIWPEALILTLMKMLQGQVAAERAAAAQRMRGSAAAAAAAAAAAGPASRRAGRDRSRARVGGSGGGGQVQHSAAAVAAGPVATQWGLQQLAPLKRSAGSSCGTRLSWLWSSLHGQSAA
ncbi:hypothetical protein COO60DRAFT_1688943, partial [Scenedesmus sp. NREL 46B-D3]